MTLWQLHGFFWCFLSWSSAHVCVIKVLQAVVLNAGPFKRLIFMLLLLRVLIFLIALPPHSGPAFNTGTVNASLAIQQICQYFSASENLLTIFLKDHSVDAIFIFIWLETNCFLNSVHFLFYVSISCLNSCHSFLSFWKLFPRPHQKSNFGGHFSISVNSKFYISIIWYHVYIEDIKRFEYCYDILGESLFNISIQSILIPLC